MFSPCGMQQYVCLCSSTVCWSKSCWFICLLLYWTIVSSFIWFYSSIAQVNWWALMLTDSCALAVLWTGIKWKVLVYTHAYIVDTSCIMIHRYTYNGMVWCMVCAAQTWCIVLCCIAGDYSPGWLSRTSLASAKSEEGRDQWEFCIETLSNGPPLKLIIICVMTLIPVLECK